MILDNIKNYTFYKNLSPTIAKGLDFLNNTQDLISLPTGKLEIDADKVFALVQDYSTKPFDKNLWEAHRTYFDIQYIVIGQEIINVARIGDVEPNMEYNRSADYQLFTGSAQGELMLKENDFIILSPEDVHQPGLALNSLSRVKKIVIKALI